MSVERQLLMAASGVSTQYTIAKSLRFRSSASAYLNRTPSVAGNMTTWTWSGWIKGYFNVASNVQLFATNYTSASTTSTYLTYANSGNISFVNRNAGVLNTAIITTPIYRDPSSWYHVVCVVDTTQSTESNRVKIYVNGAQVTALGTATYPTQNTNTSVNNSVIHTLGAIRIDGAPTQFFDGYMAEVNFIDGQALTPSSFGETSSTTGVWIPKQYSGSYGTNGFYLKFTNTTSTTTLGNDSSGNGNNWTTNNISLTTGATYDSMLDSPTNYDNGGNGVGNYAVLNPININIPGISSGNLGVTGPDNTALATIGMPSGKWYFETTVITVGAISVIGICGSLPTATSYPSQPPDGYAYLSGGVKQNNSTSVAYGASYTNGDVIGCAFDADAGTLTFYKNNVSQGVAYSSIPAKTYYFAVYGRTSGGANNCAANFGQRPFAYTPPTGFKSLCTQNLPTPSIVNGASYMAATTYTGTGASLSVSGAAFQPDLVWIKSRSAATDNKLTDSVRGTTNALVSNSTAAATTDAGGVTAFNSNGFTVGTTAAYNTNAATYIGWQWKAGGTAVTNTAGSITSQVSANTTAGFSVVTYTGTGANATVGHGLGVAPSMIISKSRNNLNGDAGVWAVYHSSLASAAYYLVLNTTAAQFNAPTVWNSTAPTASVYSVGGGSGTNAGPSATYVAYCFAAIPGYSAFGSYTGNGSADGAFIYTGFLPKLILVKCSSTTGNWYIFDSSRNTYNVLGEQIYPNLSNAGSTATTLDFLSNGFKMRTASDPNASATYIYAAFASNPFQNARAQ